jgi:hypothetical protein
MKWTEERKAQLAAMWATTRVDVIADELGSSRGAIYVQAAKQGLPHRARGKTGMPIDQWDGPRGWSEAKVARLRELWNDPNLTRDDIAKALRTSVGAIKRLDRHRGLGLLQKIASSSTRLPVDHVAIRKATTLFPNTIVAPEESPRLLVDGSQQRKLGRLVTVGRWAGMPFYALTLVERETCPRDCEAFAICYGNNMPMARRHRFTPELTALLEAELDALDAKHRKQGGYVVRLHVLGDFPTVEYAEWWHDQLVARPYLHIFGYTAHGCETPIGEAVLSMTLGSERCWIRFSGEEGGALGAIVVKSREDAPPGAIVCPYEAGKVPNCGGCGLCWKAHRTIAFLEH